MPPKKSNPKSKVIPKHHHYVFPKTLNTYLGQKGYTILKSELNAEEREMLVKKLQVIPKTSGVAFSGVVDNSFPAYRESSKKYYVPRFFGIKHFGEPKEFMISEGEDINVPFVKTLRENQIPVVNAYMERVRNQPHGGGLLELPCAYGKCLAKNTGILMYNGTIKMSQDICVGDVLMGDDSTPRIVQSIARGREKMARISNTYHDVNYVVNMSHILSLKMDGYKETMDISVYDYLNLPNELRKRLYGYRVAVNFENSNNIGVNAYDYGFYISVLVQQKNNNMPNMFLNNGNSELLLEIPNNYLCNTYKNRMQLLAGIVDILGEISMNCIVCFIKGSMRKFAETVVYLCRSLGFFSVYNKLTEKVFIYNTDDCTMPISICEIPTKKLDLISNIKATENMHKKEYLFNVEILPEDDYYGFEIDGNRRFILADYTVTHNTVLSLNIISEVGKKTLVIVHKEFLLNQWIERIREFLPNARVGRIQGQIVDIEDKDIVLGMLQSLSMKDYDAEMFASFGLTIIDEVHHISSEVFSNALFKIVSKYMLGLSATMERKDGTTNVFKMFLGEVAFKGEHTEKHAVSVRGIEYISNNANFNKVEYDYRGNPQFSSMITKLCNYGPRSDFIVEVVRDLLEEEPTSQIMILAHNRSLLEYLHDAIAYKQIGTVGYYVGGMKEKDLKITETKQIVIATYSMAAEALDIKTLSCLVMATPKTDIVQSVGRILRMKHANPRVVDIIDKHDLFQRQWGLRKRFYRKCNYRIRSIESFHYNGMKLNWDKDTTWKRVYEPVADKDAKKTYMNELSSSDCTDEDKDEEDIAREFANKKCMINVDELVGL